MAYRNTNNSVNIGGLNFGRNAFVDGLAPISVFAWARQNSFDGFNQPIVSKSNETTTGNGGSFHFDFAGDSLGTGKNVEWFVMQWSTTAGFWAWNGPQDTNWHANLVTYGYSSTSDVPRYYIDGVDQGAALSAQAPAGAKGTDAQPIIIGADNSSNQNSLDGSVAHVAIWNAILSPVEAALLAAGFSPSAVRPDALVFYCPCSQQPTQALDLGRAQLGLASVSGTWQPADDPYGLLVPARGEAPVAFSPAFQPFPSHRPNMPLLRR